MVWLMNGTTAIGGHVWSDDARLPLTQIGRQATPSRTCSESL
jgi:hypothetical protein